MGGLGGTICSSLYLAYVCAQQRKLIGLGFVLVVALAAVPLSRFQSNDTENCVEVINESSGNFAIISGKGLLRTYTWAGADRSISMVPVVLGEVKELNYPVDFSRRTPIWPGFDWTMHDGVARCCSLEMILDFKSAA
jgi:hypothetical protein